MVFAVIYDVYWGIQRFAQLSAAAGSSRTTWMLDWLGSTWWGRVIERNCWSEVESTPIESLDCDQHGLIRKNAWRAGRSRDRISGCSAFGTVQGPVKWRSTVDSKITGVSFRCYQRFCVPLLQRWDHHLQRRGKQVHDGTALHRARRLGPGR